MIIAGCEDVKISIFQKLALMLWLKYDDNLNINFDIHPNSFIQKCKLSTK